VRGRIRKDLRKIGREIGWKEKVEGGRRRRRRRRRRRSGVERDEDRDMADVFIG
jgi:hypothetical protein